MGAAGVKYRRDEKVAKKGQKRDQNGLQSNGSCETAIVKSLHLTSDPDCSNGHAASETFKAGNGQL